MKKILIFSLAYMPYFVSGAEGAIEHITGRIDPKDIEFHMITLLFGDARRRERVGNIIVHRVGFGGAYLSKILFIPLAAMKGISLQRTQRFDAIWVMMTYMLFPVVLMRMLGSRVPHILTLQDGDPYEKVFERWFIRLVAPLLDYGFRTAALVQAISVYLAQWPRKRGFKGPVEIVYNGVHPRDMHNDVSSDDVEALKQKLGKKLGDIFLINTSRLVHQKGFDTIIRALTLLPEHIKLVTTKPGTDEAMLKNLATDLGVRERIIFVADVGRNDGALYRKVADMYVAPSRSEGLGIAFISALAARLPLIATQVGGMADYVFDEEHNPDKEASAWVVDPDAPQQIADQVKNILAKPEKAKKISEDARRMVEERYDWDKIAVQMRERVFAPVIDSR